MKTTDIDKFEAYIHSKYDDVASFTHSDPIDVLKVTYDRVVYEIDHSSNTIRYAFIGGAKEWKPEVEKKPEEAPKCPYKEIIESLSEYPDKFTKALKAFRDELTKD
jgi:hypothetical protein